MPNRLKCDTCGLESDDVQHKVDDICPRCEEHPQIGRFDHYGLPGSGETWVEQLGKRMPEGPDA